MSQHHSVGFVVFCILISVFPLQAEAVRFSGNELSFTTDVHTGYDDNVTSASTDTVGDAYSQVSFAAKLERPSKTSKAWIQAGIRQDIYFGHSEFNNTAFNAALHADAQPSKYDLFKLDHTFVHADESQSFDDEFGRNNGRYSYIDNRIKASYKREFSEDFALITGYENRIYNPSRSSLRDSMQNSVALQGDWAMGTHTTLRGFYHLTHHDFDPGTVAWVHQLAGGVRRLITKTLYLDTRLGVNWIRDFQDDSQAGLIFDAQLTNELTDQTQTLLQFKHETTVNSSTPDVFESWRIQGGLKHDVSRRLQASAAAFYGEGEYDRTNLKDQLVGARIGVEYEVAEDIDASLGYNLTVVDSTGASRSYTKNRILFGVKAKF